jgi:hypothetical protein
MKLLRALGPLLAISSFSLSFSLGAAAAELPISDLDLTGSRAPREIPAVPLELAPDSIELPHLPDHAAFKIEVLREVHGRLVPIDGLAFAAGPSCTAGSSGTARFTAKLETARFAVTNGRQTYSIALDVPCAGVTRAIFKPDSNGGQALGIWQVALRAQKKLEAAVDTAFWRRRIDFSWPADGDYYSFGQVNLTRGDQWDVVGHELGHAIYDQGGIGQFGGGEHKIDECYSQALALSEGWASYFSAWVSVDLTDPDAKFEFMVPRRAPLRFETIPEDVCRGDTNEWRVIGFFWDLADLNSDGENSTETFARLWNPLLNSRVGSATEAASRLKKAEIPDSVVDLVWHLNF